MTLVDQERIAVLDHDQDAGLSRHIEITGGNLYDYDPRIAAIFCQEIPVGGVAVDGGAFIGDHTVAYAEKVGPTGLVVAFEPWLPALQCLYFNTERFPQVQVVSAGLAESRRRIQLMVDPRNGGATAICNLEKPDGIPAIPLDEFHFGRLDFIKFDLEGYELRALHGAMNTVRQHHPVVICESGIQLSRYGDSHQDLVAFMRALGYDHEMLPIQHPGGDVFDVLFRPREA